MDDINEIVDLLVAEKLAIDYSDATDEQMLALEKILNSMTAIRPHDNDTYSQHMKRYITQGFTLLVIQNGRASSYKSHCTDCREYIVTISTVLSSIDCGEGSISETDFDSVF